jgi:prepilin-type processing-associated H-X9-DG protein
LLEPQNITLAGVGLATLWCPSDPAASSTNPLDGSYYFYTPSHLAQHYTSYVGNRGTYFQGSVYTPSTGCSQTRRNAMTGVIFDHSRIKLSDVRDGTSNTMLYSEHLHGVLGSGDQSYYHWWHSGFWTDAMFDTTYPINGHRKFSSQIANEGWYFVPLEAAASFHPGGANFAMCDGSVRFLKETIDSWENDLNNFGDPIGIAFGDCSEYLLGTARPRVYQALSTRAGGEAVSSDQY